MRWLFCFLSFTLLCLACGQATEPECVVRSNWAPFVGDSLAPDSVLVTVRLCFYET